MLGVERDLPVALQQTLTGDAVDVQEDQQFGAAFHGAQGSQVPGAGQRQTPVHHGALDDRRGRLAAAHHGAQFRVVHRDDHVLLRRT
ncbi:hypothetical protein SBADM41S_11151 [Streptomyces badius]